MWHVFLFLGIYILGIYVSYIFWSKTGSVIMFDVLTNQLEVATCTRARVHTSTRAHLHASMYGLQLDGTYTSRPIPSTAEGSVPPTPSDPLPQTVCRARVRHA